MCGEDFVRRCFQENSRQSDIAVVEGVMGLFDGGLGSTALLAKTLDLPVILVIDASSSAESVAAVAKGFATLDPDVNLAGIICNGVTAKAHQQMIEESLISSFPIPVLGYVPHWQEVQIPSRHLGLLMAEEYPLQGNSLAQLIQLAEEHIKLDMLLALADRQPRPLPPQISVNPQTTASVRIGVARDAAFCFYYEDNFDLLRAAGAELVFFSPLHDETLPADLAGIYLGGGYPELYAASLSSKHQMLAQLRQVAENGMPLYAECGGFMYLCRTLTDIDGTAFKMADIFPFTASMQKGLSSLGYRDVCLMDNCILGPAGSALHGHEFHFSTIDSPGNPPPAAYLLDNERREGFIFKNVLAGYIHLHWGKTPVAAENFVNACQNFHKKTATSHES